MADNDTSPTTADFTRRIGILTADFKKEMVKQKADLDKMKQITALHKELGIEDTDMENVLNAVDKAVDLIAKELEKGPPKIELT